MADPLAGRKIAAMNLGDKAGAKRPKLREDLEQSVAPIPGRGERLQCQAGPVRHFLERFAISRSWLIYEK
jgi:hypothetical protein